MHEEKKRGFLRWNPEVNSGHLLTAVLIVSAVVGTWYRMDSRIEGNRADIRQLIKAQAETQATVRQLSESVIQQQRTQDRLSWIVERMDKDARKAAPQ